MSALKQITSSIGLLLIAASVGFATVYSFTGEDPLVGQVYAMVASECSIKGNVSIGSGERIYHVEGQRYYDETSIRPEFGERWFCSEAEARAAGWRRSGV